MIKFIVGEKEKLEEIVANRMEEIIKEKDFPKFIMATGNSPVGVYKHLVYKHREGLSFEGLLTYNLDEYLDIDKFPQDSFKKFMYDNLFDYINILPQKVYFPRDPKSYDQLIDKRGPFDFTILGVGTNGHIAFNEPGTPFSSRTHIVELEQSTIESNFPGRDSYPTRALTMGLHDIYHNSKEIILLAWGEGKREALRKLKEGKKTDEWPITHFVDHPNMTVVTDLKEFK